MALTGAEKAAMAAVDERAAALLSRTESLGVRNCSACTGRCADFEPSGRRMRMDSWSPESDRRRVECIHVGAAELRQGDRVRLRPRLRADILDLRSPARMRPSRRSSRTLRESFTWPSPWMTIPARISAHWQPGHRFFFQPDEVEPLL